MLRLSRLADYGVVLMSQMASSHDHLHNAQTMADATQLPLPTVSKVLSILARAGLLTAIRGAKGGFKLARSASQISVAEIISALDGPVALTQCIERGPGSCEVEGICSTRRGWQTINGAVQRALEGVSLAELVKPASVPRAARDASVLGAPQQQGSVEPIAGS
jgi:FeS assembly SUF system regulator